MATALLWTTKAGASKALRFDVILSEGHELSSKVTEHPVEKGASITDFVQKNLDKVIREYGAL